jgi:phosphatidylethanolamine/phosphatidyl-N-methylethanolamine N-methyltransferase
MNKQASHFYNAFSFFYPLVDYFLKPQKRVLISEINQLPTGKVLEVGVGNGSHLKFYQNHQITGIDISSAMLKHAEKQKSPLIELMEMSGEQLLFEDQKFDYVVMSHVIAVAENPNKLISEASRVLKNGGKLLILNHFTPNNPLKYLDQFFQVFSRLLQFKSVFQMNELKMDEFALEKEIYFGRFNYFKLLIYRKN